ncbi:MAG: glycosyltransferase family 4 protein [Pseudomonadota bacterium]
MKVLALVTEAFGGKGGIARYNCDFLTALSAYPPVTEIDVLPRLATPTELLPARIKQTKPVFGRMAYTALATTYAIRKQPDLVFNGHLYHSALARIAARVSGAKLLSQLHGTEVWKAVDGRHLNPMQRSDMVLCVSHHTREKFHELLDADETVPDTQILANTVRPDFKPARREPVREKYGLDDAYAILTVGRLDARKGFDGRPGYKGHDRIISTLPDLLKINPNTVYMIAGDGDDRERLEALCKQLNVSDKVRFLGQVDEPTLADLYQACDLFAMPSAGEGFGIVYLEAMASGLPAIGVQLGGAPDALRHGELGTCVPDGEFEAALVAEIQKPRQDREQLSELVHQQFGFDRFQANIHECLDELMEVRQKAA